MSAVPVQPMIKIFNHVTEAMQYEISVVNSGNTISLGDLIYIKSTHHIYSYVIQNGISKFVPLHQLTKKNWDMQKVRVSTALQHSVYHITHLNEHNQIIIERPEIRPRQTTPPPTYEVTDLTQPHRHVHTHTNPRPEPIKKEAMELFQEMFESLTQEKREAIKTKYASNEFFANQCKICNKFTQQKQHCIMSGCSGMCEECFVEYFPPGSEACPSCQQIQKIDCPICIDEKKTDDVIMGKNCNHGVCLRCFAESYRCGKPITKCPMCRVNFH